MYIYIDICEQCIVNNVETHLLRVVSVDDGKYSFNRIHHNKFSPLRCISVQRKNFRTIEIDIRDHLGEPKLIEFGT